MVCQSCVLWVWESGQYWIIYCLMIKCQMFFKLLVYRGHLYALLIFLKWSMLRQLPLRMSWFWSALAILCELFIDVFYAKSKLTCYLSNHAAIVDFARVQWYFEVTSLEGSWLKYADIAAVMLNEKKSENLIHELYSNMILFILAYMSFTLSCLNLNIFSCLLSTIKLSFTVL